jgi:hypothetical protein
MSFDAGTPKRCLLVEERHDLLVPRIELLAIHQLAIMTKVVADDIRWDS